MICWELCATMLCECPALMWAPCISKIVGIFPIGTLLLVGYDVTLDIIHMGGLPRHWQASNAVVQFMGHRSFYHLLHLVHARSWQPMLAPFWPLLFPWAPLCVGQTAEIFHPSVVQAVSGQFQIDCNSGSCWLALLQADSSLLMVCLIWSAQNFGLKLVDGARRGNLPFDWSWKSSLCEIYCLVLSMFFIYCLYIDFGVLSLSDGQGHDLWINLVLTLARDMLSIEYRAG